MNHATNKMQPSNPPSLNLSLSGAFWVFGVMFLYFPDYARISQPWSWIFIFLAYGFFLFSIVGAATSLTNLTNSDFVRFAGVGLGFGFVAFLLHNWSEGQNTAKWLSLALKFSALLSAMIGVAGIAMAIPHLQNKKQADASGLARTTNNTVQESKPTKSRFEQVISVIIALLSFMTALVPLIKAWLNIQ